MQRSIHWNRPSDAGYYKSRKSARADSDGDLRALQEIARGDGVRETRYFLFNRENGRNFEIAGNRGRKFGGQLCNNQPWLFKQSVLMQGREGRDMLIDRLDLKADRARIERIKQDHVAHRRQGNAGQVTGTISNLAIDKVEQHVEIVGSCLFAAKGARQTAGIDRALGPPPHVEEPPAGVAV